VTSLTTEYRGSTSLRRNVQSTKFRNAANSRQSSAYRQRQLPYPALSPTHRPKDRLAQACLSSEVSRRIPQPSWLVAWSSWPGVRTRRSADACTCSVGAFVVFVKVLRHQNCRVAYFLDCRCKFHVRRPKGLHPITDLFATIQRDAQTVAPV